MITAQQAIERMNEVILKKKTDEDLKREAENLKIREEAELQFPMVVKKIEEDIESAISNPKPYDNYVSRELGQGPIASALADMLKTTFTQNGFDVSIPIYVRENFTDYGIRISWGITFEDYIKDPVCIKPPRSINENQLNFEAVRTGLEFGKVVDEF